MQKLLSRVYSHNLHFILFTLNEVEKKQTIGQDIVTLAREIVDSNNLFSVVEKEWLPELGKILTEVATNKSQLYANNALTVVHETLIELAQKVLS